MHHHHIARRARSLLAAATLLAPPALASDLAVIVHKDNPTPSLTSAKLARVFKADIQEWSPRGAITLLLPKSGSVEKQVLLERVYAMDEASLKRHWTTLIYQSRIAEPPRVLPSAAVTLHVVARTSGAIAVVPAQDVPTDGSVRVLPIDDKLPGQAGYALTGGKGADRQREIERAPEPWREPRDAVARSAAVQDDELSLAERVAALEAERAADDSDDGAPQTALRGFGHVQAGFEEIDPDGASSHADDAFSLGGLDLFLTSKLSERFSFLAETVFEPTAAGDYVLDVERVIVKYHASDALKVQAGRFHTTLGWWNETFHHGEWLQTSAGRPRVLDFEDEDGLLPVHLVGLVLKGRRDVGACALDYTLEIGNGRGPTPDPPQIVVDANDSKAVNLALQISPDALPGLAFGGVFYRDSVPGNSDPSAGPVHSSFEESIYNAFAVWSGGPWQVAAEFFAIAHTDGNDADSSGWYVQVSRRFDAWTPYVRIDGVEVDDADLYFASTDDSVRTAAGVRFDVSTWSAIKVQVERTSVDAGPGGADEERTGASIQSSFAF